MPRTATATLQADTPEVRVTEWRFAPGTATGHHRHEYDYVVVPMTDGDLTIVVEQACSAERSRSSIKAGQSYFRKAGVEHDVVNETPREIVFVEIEMKRDGSRS